MLGLEWWHPKAKTKRLRPLRGRYFIRFAVRGCRFAQPPANSLNPFGVLLSRRLMYNDERRSVGTIFNQRSPDEAALRGNPGVGASKLALTGKASPSATLRTGFDTPSCYPIKVIDYARSQAPIWEGRLSSSTYPNLGKLKLEQHWLPSESLEASNKPVLQLPGRVSSHSICQCRESIRVPGWPEGRRWLPF